MPDDLICPWPSPADHFAWGYLKQGWERGRKDERERLVAWLLEEVEFVEAGQLNVPIPRFMALGRECLERYRKTGELRLFEVSDDSTV